MKSLLAFPQALPELEGGSEVAKIEDHGLKIEDLGSDCRCNRKPLLLLIKLFDNLLIGYR